MAFPSHITYKKITFSIVYYLSGKSMISPLHSFQLKHLRGSPHSEHTTTRPGASAGQLLITRWRYGNCQFWVMACLAHSAYCQHRTEKCSFYQNIRMLMGRLYASER